MIELDETTCEQLSAWMDGALSPEEARFLERRLQHDAALRAKWERLQLASNCLRGHDALPMPGVADRVAAALADTPAASRRPLLGWAVAASIAALAIAMVPRMLTNPEPAVVAAQPASAAPTASAEPRATGPTPGSADLVASTPSPLVAPVPVPPPSSPVASESPVVATAATSPVDFPLADTTRPTGWPRAGLPGSDAAMEGYLVRHNEMAGADALGGFVPYLDVVAAGEEEALPATAPPEARTREDGKQ